MRVMKPTWQLPDRSVTSNLALQAIRVSEAQIQNRLSLLSFWRGGCPESPREEPTTANTSTAHPLSGLLRHAHLSAKSRKRSPGKPQTVPPRPTEIIPSCRSPHRQPTLDLHAQASQNANPHVGKAAWRAKQSSSHLRGHLPEVSLSFIYTTSRNLQSVRVRIANTLSEFAELPGTETCTYKEHNNL